MKMKISSMSLSCLFMVKPHPTPNIAIYPPLRLQYSLVLEKKLVPCDELGLSQLEQSRLFQNVQL
jgi:hypothetical protein